MEAIFTALETSSQLKILKISKNNISSVDAGILAKVVIKMKGVELYATDLTVEQITAVCTAIIGNSRLKYCELMCNNLSLVDAGILAQAVSKLEEVGLVNTKLTPQHAEAIFAALDKSSKLKTLNIALNNFTSVDPDVLARVVNKLEEVYMVGTALTEQQKRRVVNQYNLKTNLKKLNGWWMSENSIVSLDSLDL